MACSSRSKPAFVRATSLRCPISAWITEETLQSRMQAQFAAAGRTPTEVQDAIVAALKNRAIEPQAVVALADQRTSLISVLGDVNTACAVPSECGRRACARRDYARRGTQEPRLRHLGDARAWGTQSHGSVRRACLRTLE